jgi:hypothetical protein
VVQPQHALLVILLVNAEYVLLPLPVLLVTNRVVLVTHKTIGSDFILTLLVFVLPVLIPLMPPFTVILLVFL